MATWPTTLPAPLVAGYQISPGDQTIRTAMEAGAARVRRRTRARNDQVNASWLLTEDQLAILREWFDDDVDGIAGGSAWFAVNLPVGSGTRRAAVEARFIGPISQAVPAGLLWRVSATLETR
jgi:hypothetical protein